MRSVDNAFFLGDEGQNLVGETVHGLGFLEETAKIETELDAGSEEEIMLCYLVGTGRTVSESSLFLSHRFSLPLYLCSSVCLSSYQIYSVS